MFFPSIMSMLVLYKMLVHEKWNENLMSDVFPHEVYDEVRLILRYLPVSENSDKPNTFGNIIRQRKDEQEDIMNI